MMPNSSPPSLATELADAGAQARRRLDEERIADRMALRIVHRLEVVEIEAEQGEAGAALGELLRRLLELVREGGAVRQPGQGIVQGHAPDLGIGHRSDDVPLAVRFRLRDGALGREQCVVDGALRRRAGEDEEQRREQEIDGLAGAQQRDGRAAEDQIRVDDGGGRHAAEREGARAHRAGAKGGDDELRFAGRAVEEENGDERP